MRHRLVTAAGAVIALWVLIMIFAGNSTTAATFPTSVETGRNGLAALSRWLEDAGVPVVSFRQRFDRLARVEPPGAEASLAPRGNVMITTLPYRLGLRDEEARSLEAWVRSGNTVLVLAAFDDSPAWADEYAFRRILAEIDALTGVRFRRHAGSAPLGLRVFIDGDNFELELVPVPGQPLMDGVRSLPGLSDRPRALWLPTQTDAGESLVRIASEANSGVGAAWVRPLGNGHQIIVAATSVLANHMIARGDAGRFVANVLHHHLGPGGAVLFDDLHQGLSAAYDPADFFADPRLHRTLVFIVAAWFVYVVGSSNRFAPPRPARIAPRQRDHLQAVGGFFARRLDRRDAGLMMIEDWLDEVGRLEGYDAQGSPWAALRRIPTLRPETVDRLEAFHRRLRAGRKVDLIQLHNTLRQAREAIG